MPAEFPSAPDHNAVEQANTKAHIKDIGHPAVKKHLGRIADQIENGLSRTGTLDLMRSPQFHESQIIRTATVQSALMHLGYNPASNVDGLQGPITRDAVRRFQMDAFPGNSQEHDGICGPRTTAKLIAALNDPETFRAAAEAPETDEEQSLVVDSWDDILDLDPSNPKHREAVQRSFNSQNITERNRFQIAMAFVHDPDNSFANLLKSNPAILQAFSDLSFNRASADRDLITDTAIKAKLHFPIDITNGLNEHETADFITFVQTHFDKIEKAFLALDEMISDATGTTISYAVK